MGVFGYASNNEIGLPSSYNTYVKPIGLVSTVMAPGALHTQKIAEGVDIHDGLDYSLVAAQMEPPPPPPPPNDNINNKQHSEPAKSRNRLLMEKAVSTYPHLAPELVETCLKKAKFDEVKAHQLMAEYSQSKREACSSCATDSRSCLTEVMGDLFSCSPEASLAHCVSQDLAMGKGIAVEFKKRFGKVQELLGQRKAVGEVAILQVGEKKFVYYLITKPKYWKKPTYATLRASVERMRDHCVLHGVGHLCIPRLGCGLDQLEWSKVKLMLEEIFSPTGIELTVYYL